MIPLTEPTLVLVTEKQKIIDAAVMHFFEVANSSIFIRITKTEAIRLEENYASIKVEGKKTVAYLSC